MDFNRWIEKLCEPIDRTIQKYTPWLIGFTICYVTGHVVVAVFLGRF